MAMLWKFEKRGLNVSFNDFFLLKSWSLPCLWSEGEPQHGQANRTGTMQRTISIHHTLTHTHIHTYTHTFTYTHRRRHTHTHAYKTHMTTYTHICTYTHTQDTHTLHIRQKHSRNTQLPACKKMTFWMAYLFINMIYLEIWYSSFKFKFFISLSL